MPFNLNSIILFVQNVEALKDFYTQKFHLEITEEIPSEWVVLQAGACSIALHKVGAAYESPGTNFKTHSNTKLVFEVDEDIFKLRERLLNENVSISAVKTFDTYNYRLCDGQDPEGNVFQLKQKKS